VDEGCHIPDPGESKSINDKGLTTKREHTRTPGFENMVHRIDSRTPVIFLQVSHTKKNTKKL